MNSKVELLRKYNVAGPRYTSYPTVPYWDHSPTTEQWIDSLIREMREGHKRNEAAALYVHIPFCQSLCTYCGCNTRITRNRSVGKPYVETVLKEWNLYLEKIPADLKPIQLSELHLGGGTPTFLTVEELQTLIKGLLVHCKVSDDHEWSLEADPRVTSHEHLKALRELGFTRLSLGIQDFDSKVQEAVHRIQTVEQVAEIVKDARNMGYNSINFDLIYGLPFQNLEGVRATIEAVEKQRPDRIAFYGYAHVPWIKPGHLRYSDDDIPSGEAKRALYELGRELLEKAGYREVGMDHFALESDSLWKASVDGQLHRNFMGYTSRRVTPQFGLGVSAIGDSWSAFAQNEKLLETYAERINEKNELPIHRGHVLNAEDLVLRTHILNLMTRFETNWKDPALQTPFLKEIPARLTELVKDGLVIVGDESCQVTTLGQALIRNICMAFDARLQRKIPDAQLFSKTV